MGDYKKKPRYYDHLCQVFGNGAASLESEFYEVSVSFTILSIAFVYYGIELVTVNYLF